MASLRFTRSIECCRAPDRLAPFVDRWIRLDRLVSSDRAVPERVIERPASAPRRMERASAVAALPNRVVPRPVLSSERPTGLSLPRRVTVPRVPSVPRRRVRLSEASESLVLWPISGARDRLVPVREERRSVVPVGLSMIRDAPVGRSRLRATGASAWRPIGVWREMDSRPSRV